MKTYSSRHVILTAICCFVACAGDFAVTAIIGLHYKNYDALNQSESFLGTSISPVALYMNTWGVIFSILFVLYAYGLQRTIFNEGFWQQVSVWLIVIYGLGEGIGSALFPYEHTGDGLALTGKLHLLFSTIGVIAIVVNSFVLLRVFRKEHFPCLSAYARFVAFSGLMFIMLFLLAKMHIIPLRGLWQRLFIADYYSLLIVVAVEMLRLHYITNSER
ncbi:DUF998 domain-containing protein [Niastella sp. OAS944]|uniref:DUF998 domain-containing protein n=1 Tax=Niastella sp. OAS944 TaxID=2664089 RepID=UPI0034870482|nr:hypothetical protein [Chitinophagaceae bacterium OAS944]